MVFNARVIVRPSTTKTITYFHVKQILLIIMRLHLQFDELFAEGKITHQVHFMKKPIKISHDERIF